MTTRESKAADVFAFGMLAVEIFTGKIPFAGRENEAVVFQILGGVRPDMPEDAQEVGLTVEIWEFMESCWRQNPKKRPTIGEVVVRWREFVINVNNVSDATPKCVRIISFNLVFCSVRDDLRSTQGDKTSGRRWSAKEF